MTNQSFLKQNYLQFTYLPRLEAAAATSMDRGPQVLLDMGSRHRMWEPTRTWHSGGCSSFLCLSLVIYGSKANDFFQKGRHEGLMEKKRELMTGYEDEF